MTCHHLGTERGVRCGRGHCCEPGYIWARRIPLGQGDRDTGSGWDERATANLEHMGNTGIVPLSVISHDLLSTYYCFALCQAFSRCSYTLL